MPHIPSQSGYPMLQIIWACTLKFTGFKLNLIWLGPKIKPVIICLSPIAHGWILKLIGFKEGFHQWLFEIRLDMKTCVSLSHSVLFTSKAKSFLYSSQQCRQQLKSPPRRRNANRLGVVSKTQQRDHPSVNVQLNKSQKIKYFCQILIQRRHQRTTPCCLSHLFTYY